MAMKNEMPKTAKQLIRKSYDEPENGFSALPRRENEEKAAAPIMIRVCHPRRTGSQRNR